MLNDLSIGLIIIIVGLVLLTVLVFWSRRVINRIAEKRYDSLRDILKDVYHGRS